MFSGQVNSFMTQSQCRLDEIKGQFSYIREEIQDLVPESLLNCPVPICRENLNQLHEKKLEARNIYVKSSKYCSLILPVMSWLTPAKAAWQKELHCDYKVVDAEIDKLIFNNGFAIEQRCLQILYDPDVTDSPDEWISAFLFGCRKYSHRLHHKKQLRNLYHKISGYIFAGKVSVKTVRNIARCSYLIFPNRELDVSVRAGSTTYQFHHLLFYSQFGIFRDQCQQRFPFEEISLEVPAKVMDAVFEIIEEGRTPYFRGFKDFEILRFLQVCHSLKLPSYAFREGLFWLEENAKVMDLFCVGNKSYVTVTKSLGRKGIKWLVAIDQVCPITSLDLTKVAIYPTNEVLEDLYTHFSHLNVLKCRPYSTADAKTWIRLFERLDLKCLFLDFTQGYLQEYCWNLEKALQEHPSPPKIELKNGLKIPLHYSFRYQPN